MCERKDFNTSSKMTFLQARYSSSTLTTAPLRQRPLIRSFQLPSLISHLQAHIPLLLQTSIPGMATQPLQNLSSFQELVFPQTTFLSSELQILIQNNFSRRTVLTGFCPQSPAIFKVYPPGGLKIALWLLLNAHLVTIRLAMYSLQIQIQIQIHTEININS